MTSRIINFVLLVVLCVGCVHMCVGMEDMDELEDALLRDPPAHEVYRFTRRKSNDEPNDTPVIGILSQPTSKKDQELHGGDPSRCYIAGSFAKWIEGAGARVLPLPYNVTEEVLDTYFDQINGILFTGGGCDVNRTKFYYSFQHLWNRAVKANQEGDFFPVWGICMGFQLMSIMASTPQEISLLKRFDTLNYAINLDYTPEVKNSRIFNFVGKEVQDHLHDEFSAFNNHAWGVTVDDFYADPRLSSIFKIVSTSIDREGAVFISTLEGREFPLYAVQWHPEKPIYEWQDRLLIYHDAMTIKMGQEFANFFISEARKNRHKLSEKFEGKLIFSTPYTYTTPLGSEFETCFFFNSVLWQD